MTKTFHTFTIPCEVYRINIKFVLTEDIKRAAQFISKGLMDKSINEDDFDAAGKHFYREGYTPVVWLPRFPITEDEIGTAVHEIFHATYTVMSWASIPLTQSSEEAFTHLIGYLTREFFKHKP